jgi:hypothetical protein
MYGFKVAQRNARRAAETIVQVDLVFDQEKTRYRTFVDAMNLPHSCTQKAASQASVKVKHKIVGRHADAPSHLAQVAEGAVAGKEYHMADVRIMTHKVGKLFFHHKVYPAGREAGTKRSHKKR